MVHTALFLDIPKGSVKTEIPLLHLLPMKSRNAFLHNNSMWVQTREEEKRRGDFRACNLTGFFVIHRLIDHGH